jgi:hypothetical protein
MLPQLCWLGHLRKGAFSMLHSSPREKFLACKRASAESMVDDHTKDLIILSAFILCIEKCCHDFLEIN